MARLELLEFYLTHHDDIVRCAQASVEWLSRHAGIRRAMCLAVDADAGVLVAELKISSAGLGFRLANYYEMFNISGMYALIIIIFALFCGVTIPKPLIPKFWRVWLYELNPFTRQPAHQRGANHAAVAGDGLAFQIKRKACHWQPRAERQRDRSQPFP